MTGKVTFEFPKPGEGGAAPVAAGEREDVGECPACKARVVGTGDAYVCMNGLAQPRTCDFRLGGTLLKKKISKTQVGKLLKSKRTDVIDGFVSAKTGNAFSAHLVLDGANKVTWEFVKK